MLAEAFSDIHNLVNLSPIIHLRVQAVSSISLLFVGTVGLIIIFLIIYLFRILQENKKLRKLLKRNATFLGGDEDDSVDQLDRRIQNLKNSNNILNLAMEAGNHAPFIWHLDELGEESGVYSDRYYELLGYFPSEFKLNLDTWESMVHPEDKLATRATIDEFLASQSTNDPILDFTLRYRMRKKNGEYIWVQSKGKVFNESEILKKRSVIGLITDVTAKVEAEAELRNNEERFKKIFEADTNGMLLIDASGRFVMCNRRACQIFGYDEDEWKDLRVEDLIPMEFKKGHSEHRKKFMDSGESRIMRDEKDFNALTKTGDRIKVQIGLNPVFIKNEKFSLAIVVDMTQRVKIENDLIESRDLLKIQKEKYETIFQNINDGIFVIRVLEDGSFIYREFNKAHEQITGINNQDIADKRIEEVFPSLAGYFDWRYSVCRDSGETITFQERLEFESGAKDFQTSLIPVFKDGKVFKIIGITRDITSMLESEKQIRVKEQKLRYALEASEDAIVDWDLLEEKMDVSPALNDILGYGQHELRHSLEYLVDLVNPADRKRSGSKHFARFIQRLSDNKFSTEFRMKSKEGRYVWLGLKGKVVERQGDRVKRFVGTLSDISDEKRKTREKLETILATENNERSRIAKEIHDGLQQTLTISAINIEYIHREKERLSEGTQSKFSTGWEYLQRSIAESRTVAHSLMPRDILGFGLVVAVQNLVDDYNRALEGMTFSFINNLEGKRIKDDQIELTLYRIIQESLNNIFKYAEAKEVTIQLKSYKDVLLLMVEDNGKGFHVEPALKKESSFGLKSMKNRLDAIAGHLEIDSAPGRGTVLVIEIPQNEAEPLVAEAD